MSLIIDADHNPEVFCLTCIDSLDDHPQAPNKFRKATGVLDKLTATQSTSAWNVTSCTFDGKAIPGKSESGLPAIKFEYTAPTCEDGESECDYNVCQDNDNETDDKRRFLEMVVDGCLERHFTISCAEFWESCESPSERWAQKLNDLAYQMKLELNKLVIAKLYTMLSDYHSGTPSVGPTTATIPILQQDGNINNSGFAKVIDEYFEKGWDGDVCWLGGRTMKMYHTLQKLKLGKECCQDDLLDLAFTYDVEFDKIFQELEGDTDSHMVTFPVGATAVMFFNENTGCNVFNEDDFMKTTMEIAGIEFDYNVNFVKCDTPHWNIQLKVHWCMPCWPDSVYCDGFGGFKLHWKGICSNADCSVFDPC